MPLHPQEETGGAATRVGVPPPPANGSILGCFCAVGAVQRRTGDVFEVVRAVDQRYVGERLGEVAELPLRRRVVLLGDQPDVVDEAGEALEERDALVRSRPSGRGCRRARTSRGETRPPRWEPVDPCSDVSYRRTKPVDRGASRSIASTVPTMRGSVAGRKPTRVIISVLASSCLRAVVLREGVALGVEPSSQTSRWISSRCGAPPVDRTVEPELLHRLDGAVERDPRHHLRVGEVAARRRAPPRCPRRRPSRPPPANSRMARSSAHASGPRVPASGGSGTVSRRPRRRRRAGTVRRPHCRFVPARNPRTRAASRLRTR